MYMLNIQIFHQLLDKCIYVNLSDVNYSHSTIYLKIEKLLKSDIHQLLEAKAARNTFHIIFFNI